MVEHRNCLKCCGTVHLDTRGWYMSYMLVKWSGMHSEWRFRSEPL
ncbi:hypothetical protein MM1S1530915_0331 [Mycobacteroides abscessus subsp. bolletii 1S-153-0915]|nr:hypothetical protein MM1S1530915_0331 [Mycobacteroides abscessus subsp. bolletii 1S-153-0915]